MAEQCDRCDGPGGIKTYENQMALPLNGRVQGIDWCIGHLVAALNAGNVRTVASCCGHKQMPGIISLEDGRTLLILGPEHSDANELMRQAIEIKPPQREGE